MNSFALLGTKSWDCSVNGTSCQKFNCFGSSLPVSHTEWALLDHLRWCDGNAKLHFIQITYNIHNLFFILFFFFKTNKRFLIREEICSMLLQSHRVPLLQTHGKKKGKKERRSKGEILLVTIFSLSLAGFQKLKWWPVAEKTTSKFQMICYSPRRSTSRKCQYALAYVK